MKIDWQWVVGPILALAGAGTALAGPPGRLHVPSPEWRDQVIYFALTDRFDDGDPSRYSGGDFRGRERRLDYLWGLGATAVWVTPPVAHLW